MTQIVSFSLDFEDEAIIDKLKKNAYNDIIKNIQDDLEKEIFDDYGSTYTGKRHLALSSRALNVLESSINDMKPEIIDLAAKYLADKIYRLKATKEMTKKVLDGENKDE